jgi:hypothetical protein
MLVIANTAAYFIPLSVTKKVLSMLVELQVCQMHWLFAQIISLASLASQLSISPTFCEQLLRQNPLAKKLQTQIVST